MQLTRLTNQLPSLFDRFLENDMFDWSTRNFSNTNTTLPSVNIKEDSECYKVEMAVPGFEKNDIRVELNNDLLTISSEKKIENETRGDEQFTKREFSYQSFNRSFTLPATVENDKIMAKYENGILRVIIPKSEATRPKPTKQITIT